MMYQHHEIERGVLDPNDTQPGGPSGRTVTIHLTRDTLILVAALIFLAIAILLAIVFPPASTSSPTPASTSVALDGTAPPGAAHATTVAVTSGAVQSAPTLVQSGPPTSPAQGYPAPAIAPTSTTNASLNGVPTFAPIRPTQVAGGPAGGSNPEQPYPPPSATAVVPTRATSRATATNGPGEGSETSTAVPTVTPQLFEASPTVPPTPRLAPTTRPTAAPVIPREPAPPPTPRPTPLPTAIPIDVLRGTIRWTAAQSPILIRRDTQLAPGALLMIEAGVEVRLAPGVSFFVDGTMYGLGRPDSPVRFVGSERQRWEGLFGRPGSNIALEYTDIRGGGAGGTVLSSTSGNLVLHHAHVNDNGGHVRVDDSRLEMRDSEIAGNDMPYGAALEATYSNGGIVILTNNRIGGNRMAPASAPVQISSYSPFETVNLDVQRNLLIGQDGPDLLLFANGPVQGGMTCNALMNGADGLSIRSEAPQVPGFALNVRDNAIEDHTPPIIPIYLTYGIGRGATSELALDMRNNWWGSPLGPYEPDRHADGRGEAVGDNIEFAPWATERPACAPTP